MPLDDLTPVRPIALAGILHGLASHSPRRGIEPHRLGDHFFCEAKGLKVIDTWRTPAQHFGDLGG